MKVGLAALQKAAMSGHAAKPPTHVMSSRRFHLVTSVDRRVVVADAMPSRTRSWT
jgi:hypothetical protein